MVDKQPWHYRTNCRMPEGQKLPSGIFRYAAAIEYDGGGYCGWQRQLHCRSVQSEVEKALSSVANEPIIVACAGRTDTGVHATTQMIHFDTQAIRSPNNWVKGSNANMPRDIRCHWAGQVPESYHARFSAVSRTYRYVVLNTSRQPALLKGNVTWERRPLCLSAMQEAASALIGEHDFSAFRAAHCHSMTPWRHIYYLEIFSVNDIIVFEICANAFLLHMVRNIVGALLTVGREEQAPDWLAEILSLRDRTKAPMTAPAAGLYLVGAAYPPQFGLPGFNAGPCFIGRELKSVVLPDRLDKLPLRT